MRSIRSQLALLIAILAVPLLALQVRNGVLQYRLVVERAEDEVLETAERVAVSTAEIVSLARSATVGVADRVAPLAGGPVEPQACARAVDEAKTVLPFLASVGVLRSDGTFVCSSPAVPDGYSGSARDRGYFQELMQTGRPVVSPPIRGRFTGEWRVVLGAPVTAPDGSIPLVAVTSLDLLRFQDLVSGIRLPADALMTITDENFQVIARSAEPDRWIGRSLPSVDLDAEDRVDSVAAITRAEDLRGTPRTFGRVRIPETGWYAYAGLPDSVVYAPARQRATTETLLTLAVIAVALLVGVIAYRHIAGSLRLLVARVREAAEGGQVELPREGPAEIRAVARQMNRTLAQRARAEAAERTAKERYRSVVDNAVFGIYVSRPDGTLVEVNPALTAMLGYDSAEELREAGAAALYPDPEIRERLVREHLTEGRPIRNLELTWCRRDGTEVVVRLNGNIISSAGGEPLFEMIVEDITEQKALEAEYRHTQKMEAVGRLAGGVAHDFNNLLTVILGHTNIILTNLEDGHPARDGAEEVLAAGERAATLTRQLLAFSRKEVTQPRVLNINRTIGGLERMLGRLLGEEIVLSTRMAPDLAPVRMDPGQVEQILLNLILNARDALPRGGHITVTTRNGPPILSGDGVPAVGSVILEVSDDGTGMTPDVRDRIFEPFFTTKPEGEGTGLGLSTVYGVVSQAGGHVEVDTHAGDGTTFTVHLPGIPDAPPPPREEPGDRDTDHAGETILLAEDEYRVRDVVKRVLERAGYTVITAEDGLRALDVARKDGPRIDLLLTDVVMPRMGGLELAERLNQLRPDVPILFMSGYTESEALRERTRADASVFISKPFTPVELQERVAEILARHRSNANVG